MGSKDLFNIMENAIRIYHGIEAVYLAVAWNEFQLMFGDNQRQIVAPFLLTYCDNSMKSLVNFGGKQDKG